MLYGLPTGGFGERQDLSVGNYALALAPADLNSDGVPDLAVMTIWGVRVLYASADTASPAVAEVRAAGTDWEQSFLDCLASEGLGEGGYAIPVGPDEQLDELPWVNIDQIVIRFDEDVDVEISDLTVYGVNVPQYAFGAFAYDTATHTATWTLTGPVAADKLLLVLSDGVTDAAGNSLDGEWVDGSGSHPSGDGAAGGEFRFRLNVLPGDVDGSGEVRSSDTVKVRRKSNTAPGDPDYSCFYDVDCSGEIRSSDTIKVRRLSNTELPGGEPVVPAAAPPGGPTIDAALIAAALRAGTRRSDRDSSAPVRADVLAQAAIVPLVI